jgi:hypothetical protein
VVNDTDPSARCHGEIARAVDYQVRIRRRFTALPPHLGSDPEWKSWWNAVAGGGFPQEGPLPVPFARRRRRMAGPRSAEGPHRTPVKR